MNEYLKWMAGKTTSAWWHDSADLNEVEKAMESGAVGVTTNPVLVKQALFSSPEFWNSYLTDFPENLKADAKAEEIIRRITVEVAAKLLPIYEKTGGEQGYVCAQVNPGKTTDREGMMEMAERLHAWAPNIAVKIPGTAVGLDVLEDCAARGMTMVSTVSFTLPQVLAAAERYEKGRARCIAAGKKPAKCFAVVMVGRIDDFIRDVVRDNQYEDIKEEDILMCGTGIMKRALEIFEQKGYNAILMPAGMRGAYHAQDLAGASLTMSIHPKIQALLEKSSSPFKERHAEKLEKETIKRLSRVEAFRKAYEPDVMPPSEFITYGVVQKTLAQFSESWSQLEGYTLP